VVIPLVVNFDKFTDIFCLVDGFCNNFDNYSKDFILGNPSKQPSILSKSEVITITILFHFSDFRYFKHFYIYNVQKQIQDDFPNTVSFNRFLELKHSVLLPMTIFIKTCCLGN